MLGDILGTSVREKDKYLMISHVDTTIVIKIIAP